MFGVVCVRVPIMGLLVLLCEGFDFVWCCLCDGAFCVRGLVWVGMLWGCYGFLGRGCCFGFHSGRLHLPGEIWKFKNSPYHESDVKHHRVKSYRSCFV